jgi:hypothetical protein
MTNYDPTAVTQQLRKELAKEPNSMLFFDIETSPMLVWTHYIGQKVSINHKQIHTASKVITIQYMFEGEKKPTVLIWNNGDDRKILKDFVSIINSAKVVVGQNSANFDFKTLQWRLNYLGLKPMSEVVMIDTLRLSRSAFRAPSHRLDYRSSIYGEGGKMKMDFADWVAVTTGDKKALDKMVKYGAKDVLDLRAIFWRELPYYKRLPVSLARLLPGGTRDHCPKCASKRQRKFDVRRTLVKSTYRFECNNCSHIWRDLRAI